MIRPRLPGLLLGLLFTGACTPRPNVIMAPFTPPTIEEIIARAAAETLLQAPIADPRLAGTIMITGITPPPSGTNIGAHHEGVNFQLRTGYLYMEEAVHRRWAREWRSVADSLMRGRGFRTRDVAASSSDATMLHGVRLTLSARVDSLVITSTGRANPRIRAAILVEWELVDLSRGTPSFLGIVPGSAPEGDSLEAVVRAAFASSLNTLIESTAFRTALARPRRGGLEDLISADYVRSLPRPGDTVYVRPGERFSSKTANALEGLVALRDLRHYQGSAIVISTDGLAIAPASSAGQQWLFARSSIGIDHPVRVLRVAGDLALLELSCPMGCSSVAWLEDEPLTHEAPAFIVAARSGGIEYKRGSMRFRDREGAWSIRGAGTLVGGEAIVSTHNGAVIGVATRTGVLPLRTAFELLALAVRIAPPDSATEAARRP